jgi:hypothetical protein
MAQPLSFRPARRLRKDLTRTAGRRVGCAILILLVLVLIGLYVLASSLQQRRQSFSHEKPATVVLLNTPDSCIITTDVRGNLGPPEVMLNNGTDWLKDRWQAASDMGGTAIQGSHWVQIEFQRSKVPSYIHSVILDWETAYSDHYLLQIRQTNGIDSQEEEWTTIFTAPEDDRASMQVTRSGQSPGVKKPMPLHVIQNVTLFRPVKAASMFRILILKSNTGWGVSLWRVQLFGMW